MTYYRKKPVTIEAMEFTYPPTEAFKQWIGHNLGEVSKARAMNALAEAHILTLEDGTIYKVKHIATEGDFIIKGVEGDFYPCKPHIFWQTYDKLA